MPNSAHNSLEGFTIIELLVVLTIIVIISSVALPATQKLLRSQESAQFLLLHKVFTLARNKAATQPLAVYLCGSSNAISCDNNWSTGWLMFSDKDNNGLFDADIDQLLRYEAVKMRHGTIKWTGSAQKSAIKFMPLTGYSIGHNGTMRYCGVNNTEHRGLILNDMGRARLSVDTNKDGIHEDASGKPFTC